MTGLAAAAVKTAMTVGLCQHARDARCERRICCRHPTRFAGIGAAWPASHSQSRDAIEEGVDERLEPGAAQTPDGDEGDQGAGGANGERGRTKHGQYE